MATRSARGAALAGAAVLTLLTGCQVTRTPPLRPELEALIAAQQDAWNRGDIAAFMELGYWRSPDLTFYSGGEVSRGFEPMLERYRRKYEAPGAERGRLAFTQLEFVPLADDVALARGRWDLDFEAAPDVGGLFTLVLRRLPDGWRIVHDHTSVD